MVAAPDDPLGRQVQIAHGHGIDRAEFQIGAHNGDGDRGLFEQRFEDRLIELRPLHLPHVGGADRPAGLPLTTKHGTHAQRDPDRMPVSVSHGQHTVPALPGSTPSAAALPAPLHGPPG